MSGGPPVNPLTMRLCELLDDGEWHPVEPIMREIGKLIPPGKAVRRAEARRAKQSRSLHGGEATARTQPVSHERLIQFGRRSFARDAINASGAHFEKKHDGEGVELIRMRELPPRVLRERSRARAHQLFDPVDIADEIRDGADAHALLSELNPGQLLRAAKELAARERARALS